MNLKNFLFNTQQEFHEILINELQEIIYLRSIYSSFEVEESNTPSHKKGHRRVTSAVTVLEETKKDENEEVNLNQKIKNLHHLILIFFFSGCGRFNSRCSTKSLSFYEVISRISSLIR